VVIGIDFSGDVDTKQYTLSSYGALELSSKGSIEAVLGVAKIYDRRPINVFPTLESKALLANLFSLRTAWAITLTFVNSSTTVTSITLDFEIVRGLDANKFTLVGNKLTFEAPAFNDRQSL
jgi:hypothetical protein